MIGDIIGPEQASATLFQPFCSFLRDADVQAPVLEHLALVILGFKLEEMVRSLDEVDEVWSSIRNWRMREHVANELIEVGNAVMKQSTGMVELLSLLGKALLDSVAAVRDAAVETVRFCHFDSCLSVRLTLLQR